MSRSIDAMIVLSFAAATALIGFHERGFPQSTLDDHAEATTLTTRAALEPYSERVARILPSLERHVAAGSMRDRTLVCDADDRLADIGSKATELGDGRDDPLTAAVLAEGIRALRECVACTPEPHGCADAARAFTEVEGLVVERAASGI